MPAYVPEKAVLSGGEKSNVRFESPQAERLSVRAILGELER
jgi:hypothetical protein